MVTLSSLGIIRPCADAPMDKIVRNNKRIKVLVFIAFRLMLLLRKSREKKQIETNLLRKIFMFGTQKAAN